MTAAEIRALARDGMGHFKLRALIVFEMELEPFCQLRNSSRAQLSLIILNLFHLSPTKVSQNQNSKVLSKPKTREGLCGDLVTSELKISAQSRRGRVS